MVGKEEYLDNQAFDIKLITSIILLDTRSYKESNHRKFQVNSTFQGIHKFSRSVKQGFSSRENVNVEKPVEKRSIQCINLSGQQLPSMIR